MNNILKLLGTSYSMTLEYDYFEEGYRVTIRDRNAHAAQITFCAAAAEEAKNDILTWAIEDCIYEIKQHAKHEGENK